MTAVHQFVPSYVGRTAIATHVGEVQRALRAMGLESRIYVGEARDVPMRDVKHYRALEAEPGTSTWLLYQLSIGHPMADFLAARQDRLMVNYHNVTPAEMYRAWEPLVVPELTRGREQLRELAHRSEMGIAVSAYNERELKEAGYPSTTTVPVLVDFEALADDEDLPTAARLEKQREAGAEHWLFVGRISPNKAQHRLILALAAYRQMYGRDARLHLVGGISSHSYQVTLEKLARALGVARQVHFVGSIPQAELVAHYRHSDVYVSLSEHEGFGIPLVEAMWNRLPVVALGSSGVPGTVGSAGLLLPTHTEGLQPPPPVVAAAVSRVIEDRVLRGHVVARGLERSADFALERTRASFQKAVEGILGT